MNRDYKYETEHVCGVLRDWDPLGVRPGQGEDAAPADEYDSYSPGIISLLRSGAAAGEVLQHLTGIRNESLELPAAPEIDGPVAEQLVLWWKNRRRS